MRSEQTQRDREFALKQEVALREVAAKEEKVKEGNADKVQNQNVGKRNADTHYCIFVTKDRIPELEHIKTLYNNKFKNNRRK